MHNHKLPNLLSPNFFIYKKNDIDKQKHDCNEKLNYVK